MLDVFCSLLCLNGGEKIHVCVRRRSELGELESLGYPSSIELKFYLLPGDLEPNDALRCLNVREISADAEYLVALDCDEYFYAYDRSIKTWMFCFCTMSTTFSGF